MLWRPSKQYPREQLGTLVHGMSGDQSAERMGYDECPSASATLSVSMIMIAGKSFEESNQLRRKYMERQPPVVSVLEDTATELVIT